MECGGLDLIPFRILLTTLTKLQKCSILRKFNMFIFSLIKKAVVKKFSDVFYSYVF